MEINWVTFTAQIVNFFVLVFVLQRLLYKPIVKAMERREQTIRDRLNSAEQKQQEAQQEVAHYQQMQADLAARQAELLTQAQAEVEQTRQRLLQEVRDAAAVERSQWQASLRRQKEAFLQEVRHRTMQQLQATVQLVLKDLAEVTLEAQVAKVFLQRLQNLADRDRIGLVTALTQTEQQSSIALTLVSAFELPESIRTAIAQVLQNYLNAANLGDLDLDCETQPDLICGIELRGRGYKLTWSIEAYLDAIAENLASVLVEEIGEEISEEIGEEISEGINAEGVEPAHG
ncbi:hypothetical protein TUMEXPCC7403_00415 [Tumidithrix helvetica PCC 7403]|uniref:F0F1 ATP synthase subunit B family protein n=1 Tax=Tumidithrix helvetica TaxID=3457545 RepID=UPI003C990877